MWKGASGCKSRGYILLEARCPQQEHIGPIVHKSLFYVCFILNTQQVLTAQRDSLYI